MSAGRLLLILATLSIGCATRREASLVPLSPRSISPSAVPTVMRRQVLNAIDAGEGDFQLRKLRRQMAVEPGNLQVRLELAAHYERLGYPELATEHYRLAAERFPDNAGVHIRLAKSLRSLGMRREAAKVLDEFLTAQPGAPAGVFSWLGIVRDELGELERAEQAHRRAVALAPTMACLHNNLGYNFLLQGRKEQAADEFRKALAIEPHSDVARNNLGMALSDRPAEAVLQWQSVSDPATAHNNLAAVLIEEGRYAEARKEINTALGYKQGHSAALRNLELVSELDGGAATLDQEQPEGFWKHFADVMRRAFLEPAPETAKGTVNTASQ